MKAVRSALRLAFAVLLIVSFISCAKSPQEKLIGEWRGTDNVGDTGSLIFNEDGSATLIQGDLLIDDKAVDGKVTWRLDTEKDPMQLDIVITDSEGREDVLPMILAFVDDKNIKVRISDDLRSRPEKFDDNDKRTQIILTRQKK